MLSKPVGSIVKGHGDKRFYPKEPSLSRDTSEVRSCLRVSVRGGFTAALATKQSKQLYQI